MEQYEFTTPNGTKFTIISEEVSNGWLTQVEVVNKIGEVYKYAWVSPFGQCTKDENKDLRKIVDIVRDNY